jgi:hypothetical protein
MVDFGHVIRDQVRTSLTSLLPLYTVAQDFSGLPLASHNISYLSGLLLFLSLFLAPFYAFSYCAGLQQADYLHQHWLSRWR